MERSAHCEELANSELRTEPYGRTETPVTMVAATLSDEETRRGLGIYQMMDSNNSGTVTIDEICIVHDSDKEAMVGILDTDGDGQVPTAVSCDPPGGAV